MPLYAETLGLSDPAFVVLRDLVQERTGLYFDNNKSELLADKLSPLVLERGFDSFLDYYYFLKHDPAAAEEWPKVMDALSVQETYFWREMDQVEALVQVIMPQWTAANPRMPLRIWSAACASGEEPLSLAIALDREGWFQRAPVEMIASDASPAAIEKARRGVYRERSFRALPPALRERYFTPGAGGEQIRPEVHARIHWQVANLMVDSEIAAPAHASVIFCRNVFIYFSDRAIRKAVQLFFRKMRVPGYLFVGASESLLRLTTDFELQEIGGAFVYVKP